VKRICIGFVFFYFSALQAITEELAFEATDPIKSLAQMQFQDDLSLVNYRSSDIANIFYVKPVIPIKAGDLLPIPQVLRFQFQLITVPKSSTTSPTTALGDTQAFDLFIFERTWGEWGLGPMAILPTATSTETGQGKWQIGPALGLNVMNMPRWQWGFLAQNPISFAGNTQRKSQNYLLFQPFFVRHFPKGWYINSNAQWTIDWLRHAAFIPLNIGGGRVFDMGNQPVNFSTQAELTLFNNTAGVAPRFLIKFNFSILFGD